MQGWDDLEVFVGLARAGTMAGAATAMGINPSTVLRRLRTLEAGLGVALFERSSRGTRLTAAGEALLPRAEEAEEAWYAARRAVLGHDQTVAGTVRLTLVDDLLPTVAPMLADFLAHCPAVKVVVVAAPEQLQLGRTVDVALRLGVAPPSSAVGRKLCAVSWARYRAAAKTDDNDVPWAIYSGLDQVPAVRWRRRIFEGVRAAVATDTVSAMQGLLRALPVQGLLPCHVGDADPQLMRIGEPIDEAQTTLWMLIHADLRRSARVRALVDFLTPRLVAERTRFAP